MGSGITMRKAFHSLVVEVMNPQCNIRMCALNTVISRGYVHHQSPLSPPGTRRSFSAVGCLEAPRGTGFSALLDIERAEGTASPSNILAAIPCREYSALVAGVGKSVRGADGGG